MPTLQQTNDFRINGIQITYPPMPYEWIDPPVTAYSLSGKPMRQGKPSCIWHFRGKSKTAVEDELRSFLSNRNLDTLVTIRTLNPALTGYQFSDFTAWAQIPKADYKSAILNDFVILFTFLVPA